jgi:tetratricopeptide (TPR) repeat protein
MVAAYKQSGLGGEAATWYAVACSQADGAADLRWRIRLLSCAVLFVPPAVALGRVRQAEELAKAHGLQEEIAVSRANLGLVWLELGDLATAQKVLRASLEELSGRARAVALNNLALAVGHCDRRQALRLIASALACTQQPFSSLILANQAAFEAEGDPLRLPDFASLADWVAEDWARSFAERVRFNQARALFEDRRGSEALVLADGAGIEEKDYRDGALVAGQWARLCREVHRAAGRRCPSDVQARAERLDRSQVPQAWLYRLRWACCPIPFYEPPPLETAEPVQHPGKEEDSP